MDLQAAPRAGAFEKAHEKGMALRSFQGLQFRQGALQCLARAGGVVAFVRLGKGLAQPHAVEALFKQPGRVALATEDRPEQQPRRQAGHPGDQRVLSHGLAAPRHDNPRSEVSGATFASLAICSASARRACSPK